MVNNLEIIIGSIRGLRLSRKAEDKIVSDLYDIPGSSYFSPPREFQDPRSWTRFQEDLSSFQDLLIKLVTNGEGASFLKFGDGDYYFLKGIPLGSAAPGNRAISTRLSRADLKRYRVSSRLADFYMCELVNINRRRFKSVFRSRKIDFPAEFSYGLLASRWLTATFAGDIGIIGSSKKLDLIRDLTREKEYQDYLGLSGFQDYIPIPEKFAADNLEERLIDLENLLKSSSSKIFLVGIGHLKSGVIGNLRKFKEAVYLDVGSGIDALAGLIDTRRPYMAEWINHQFSDQNRYEGIDLLDFNSGNVFCLPGQVD